jgi:hypothetical protein
MNKNAANETDTRRIAPTEREMELAQEIAESLDAILAHAFTLEQDLTLAYKWPPFPQRPFKTEPEHAPRAPDVFDNNRLGKRLGKRISKRVA